MQLLSAKPILILLMGDTFPILAEQHGNFNDWILNGLGDTEVEVIRAQEQDLPEMSDYAGVIISGAHEMVTDRASWSEQVSDWLRQNVDLEIPILGICYGHQLLAQTFGGEVAINPKGLEIGVHQICVSSLGSIDPLFKDITTEFLGYFVHYQSVIKLPDSAQILAYNQHDKYQSFVMSGHMWGVQFHPEFTQEIMQNYLFLVKKDNNYFNHMNDKPHKMVSTKILSNFKKICGVQ